MDAENVKLEYVLQDGNLHATVCEQETDYENVIYASDLQTIFVHNGEYYMQTKEEMLLGNEQDEIEQLVISTDGTELETNVLPYLQEEHTPIVYKFTDKTQSLEPSAKKLKLESNYVMLGSEDLTFDMNDHLSIVQDDEQGDLNEPVQYAILKDGYFEVTDGDSIEFLNNFQTEATQDGQVATNVEESIVDLTKVTGRNLITGHIVTLDDYLERIQNKIIDAETSTVSYTEAVPENNFINRKFTIKNATNGKKLVGKIVDIKTSDLNKTDDVYSIDLTSEQKTNDVYSIVRYDDLVDTSVVLNDEVADVGELNDNINDAQELILDASIQEDISELYNRDATPENVEFVSKTLAGLVTVDSVRRKLLDCELCITLVGKLDLVDKTMTYFKGFLQLEQDNETYKFVLSDNDTNGKETSVSLSIIVSKNKNGHNVTRVHFYEKLESATSCKVCKVEFKSIGHLSRHMATSHSDKNCRSMKSMNSHRKKHEQCCMCEVCGKNFASQSSLRRHMSVHNHNLRPLECTLCNSRFTDESSLCKHLITHTGIKAYCCKTCNKSFATVGDLNVHQRIHSSIKYSYCEVCGREFTRHSNLLRHAEIHRGEEGYLCRLCGCGYKYVSSLTRHVVQNHMNKI